MKKRIITISILAILLITSACAIYAEDVDSNSPINTIPVKIVWNGDNQNLPDQVVVKLIEDGSVVDSTVLSKENSWKSNFTAEDGSYSVQMDNLSGYSISVSGNAVKGYIITAKAVASSTLGSVDNSPDNSSENMTDVLGDVNKTGTDTNNNTSNDTNKTNPTENNSTSNDTNKTKPAENNTSNDANKTNQMPADNRKNNTTVKIEETKITNITKETKVINEPDKNNTNNTTANPLKNTGFPIVALIAVVGVIALAPIIRRK